MIGRVLFSFIKIKSIHIISRNFKTIELLLDYQLYDCAHNILSFDIMMYAILFKRNSFFNGADDIDMLECICDILGRKAIS